MMKTPGLAVLIAAALLAACTPPPPSKTRITCANAYVFLSQAQMNALLIQTGADAGQVCAVADKMDVESYATPTAVTVVVPSGQSFDVEVQSRGN